MDTPGNTPTPEDLPHDAIANRKGISIGEVERQMASAIYKIGKQIDGHKLSWWERWF